MKDQFISYGQSLKLRSIGFDEKCIARIYKTGQIHMWEDYVIEGGFGHNSNYAVMSVPLYQQVFSWFLKEHGKNVLIFSDGIKWMFDIRSVPEDSLGGFPSKEFPVDEGKDREFYDTYRDAEIASIDKLIELF